MTMWLQVRLAGHCQRSGHSSVYIYSQRKHHVVGGGEGKRLQELEDLTEGQTSNPVPVKYLPHQLTCNIVIYLEKLSKYKKDLFN